MALIEYVALVILAGLVLAWEAWSPGQAGAEPMTLLFWILANMLGELLWLPAPKQRGYLAYRREQVFVCTSVHEQQLNGTES